MSLESNANTTLQADKKIIFFDGVCNLCNGFVDFVIKRDKQKQLFFCSLQSNTAREILEKHDIALGNTFSTIYFFENGMVYDKSKAILYAIKYINPKYKFLGNALLIIPAFIRDFIYFYISKYRYKILGKKETCRMPSKAERSQFL
ncbi:thiol-disulfide oxidoreductase DCC family protein [Algibacter pacificus]|uniref:thiol-disulfide oxidoreductase DCC family protein n=1 Tax=Algibacter pacificus TaxID=2599389 RepID=UPI0011C73896|nr:DCC1-like thiol-disulfide oxidoreductase family protein [Algibacter pacificus]